MTPQPFDFRKPPPLPAALRAALNNWAEQVCSQAARLWAMQLPFRVEMRPQGVEVLTAARALEPLPESAVRFRAALEPTSETSLLAASRPLLVAVLGGLLGNPPDPDNLDVELTPVEEEMVEFVAEQFFLGPVQQAWPLAEKLRLAPPRREPVSADPAYLPSSLVLTARFQVRGEFGELDWWWMLPREGWLASLISRGAAPAPARAEREAAVRDLPLKLTVQLGGARLSLLHLAALKEGDLLLLDQPIDQPLPALLGGQPKFLVRPGARGPRQAVSIQTPIES